MSGCRLLEQLEPDAAAAPVALAVAAAAALAIVGRRGGQRMVASRRHRRRHVIALMALPMTSAVLLMEKIKKIALDSAHRPIL